MDEFKFIHFYFTKKRKSYEFTIIRRRTEIFERRIPEC